MSDAKKFSEHLDQCLKAIGYRRLPISKAAYALFFKKIDQLYLTLSIERSSKMPGRFTASFYLAPLLSWPYAPIDEFPMRAYRRIGECLTVQDRRKIEPDAEIETVDVWWKGYTLESVQQFTTFVPGAEKKFLSSKELQKKVLSCKAMVDLQSHLVAVKQEVDERKSMAHAILDKVKKEDHVPLNWYLAAANVAKLQHPLYYHKDGIKMLAEEAWLIYEGQFQNSQ